MSVTQTQILDRFHEINTNVLTLVTGERYFIPSLFANSAQQPCIIPYVQRRSLNNRTSGSGGRFTTYAIEQMCIVGQYGEGIVGQSISEDMEAIIEEVETVYAGRLRLDYDGNELVHHAQYDGATIPRPDPKRGAAIILFSHTVTTFAARTIGG